MALGSNTQLIVMACLLCVCAMVIGAKGQPHAKRPSRLPRIFINASLPESPGIHSYSKVSLSPWNFIPNNDVNRFPPSILEANCTSEGCFYPGKEENQDLLSKPIKRQIMVLRRAKDSSGLYYELDYLTITVGCTCIRPMLQH